MLSIIGQIIVFTSVILGYVLHHGNIFVLWQPTEYLIIGGAALGSLVTASSPTLIKNTLHAILGVFTAGGSDKNKYLRQVS